MSATPGVVSSSWACIPRSSNSTADPGVVAAAVRDEGLPYPVLLDQDRGTWLRFANHYWPAKYLVDARGYLRYEHFGEGAYGETEEWIQRLLREAGDTAPMPEPLEPVREEDRPGAVCYPATREIHAGYHRGKLLAPEGYRPGEEVRHREREEGPAPPGMFSARGLWLHHAESLESPRARRRARPRLRGLGREPRAGAGGRAGDRDGRRPRAGRRAWSRRNRARTAAPSPSGNARAWCA